MKIKIDHIQNTFNYGSLMMAINTLNFLNKEVEEVEFYVDCISKEDIERIIKETNIQKIYPCKKNIFSATNIISKIIKQVKIAQLEAKQYDCKIVLGGDDISEYYAKNGWAIKFPIMYLKNRYLPTILIGQTIGPFTGYRKILARWALNMSVIYTRDDNCLEYLKKMGLKSARKGRDLAFLELPYQKNTEHILDKYELRNTKFITIVTSGLSKWYTTNYSKYLEEQIKIIRNLLNNTELTHTKIVLLAHVLKPENVDDRKVIKDLETMLSRQEKERIIFITDKLLASEARQILGNGLFTITGRMHAAVSTFYMRKPAISLSYSVKYEGVIGSGLDMKELVIECANEELWTTGQVSKQVAEKVDYVLKHYERLIYKINQNVTTTSEMAIKQLENAVQDIKAIQVKIRK
ncbi:MAG: polysaccharide pyruvyl transferase family protein [Cellulosilyticaceae bacterium]